MKERQASTPNLRRRASWILAAGVVLVAIVIGAYVAWPKSHRSQATVAVLRYATLNVEQVWDSQATLCAPSQQLSDEAILGKDGMKPSLAIQTRRVGGWFHVIAPPADFGSEAIFNACDGEALFGGMIVWNGHGEQTYPTKPAYPLSIELIPETDIVDTLDHVQIDSYWLGANDSDRGESAWRRAARIPQVNARISDKTEVFVHLYPGSVAIMDPDGAYWVVVFVYN